MDGWLSRSSVSGQNIDLFEDESFPPNSDSIDGRKLSTIKGLSSDSTLTVFCACQKPSRLRKVSKDGPSQGRYFYCCEYRVCNYFKWGDFAPHDSSLDNISWQRFGADKGWSMIGSYRARNDGEFEFLPCDVRQGGVGDCWFLSALAVVAERSDLINAIVRTKPTIPKNGRLDFRLFLDGKWRDICVDSFLPCRNPEIGSKRKGLSSDGSLIYSHAAKRQLWVPFLEKAYAKAHGSYQGISGGNISEAMLDLTGLPCEVISFSTRGFNSDRNFERMLSFKSCDFPMGCCSFSSGEGIIGGHAYSILDVRELADCSVAEQLSLDQLFRGNDEGNSRCLMSDIYTEMNSIRLLRIRNPWGHKEWSGNFSYNSTVWTNRLRKQLDVGERDDGTFWITYHDFLRRFEMVEVCKAHRGWTFARSIEGSTVPTGHQPLGSFTLTIVETSWLYLTCIQRTKRGRNFKADDRAYWYHSVQLLVVDAASGALVASRLGGAMRDTAVLELQLSPGQYLVVPVTFGVPVGKDTEKSEPFVTRIVACDELLAEPVQREFVDTQRLSEPLVHAARELSTEELFSYSLAPQAAFGLKNKDIGSCADMAIDLCSCQPEEFIPIEGDKMTPELQIQHYMLDGISFLGLRNSSLLSVKVSITLETCNFRVLSAFLTSSKKNDSGSAFDNSSKRDPSAQSAEQLLKKTSHLLEVSISGERERLIAVALRTQLYEGVSGIVKISVVGVTLEANGHRKRDTRHISFVFQEVGI